MTLEYSLFSGPAVIVTVSLLGVLGFLIWAVSSQQPSDPLVSLSRSRLARFARIVPDPPFNPELIARLCYETNAAISRDCGEESPPSWEKATEQVRSSCLKGVRWRLANLKTSVEAQHTRWCQDKLRDGWVFGATKDPQQKTHPCLGPYSSLPLQQQIKDHIFIAIVITTAKVTDMKILENAVQTLTEHMTAGRLNEAAGILADLSTITKHNIDLPESVLVLFSLRGESLAGQLELGAGVLVALGTLVDNHRKILEDTLRREEQGRTFITLDQ